MIADLGSAASETSHVPEDALSSDPLHLLSRISSDLLRTELLRRNGDTSEIQTPQRPACGAGSDTSSSYNTSLHIFGLFVILVLSTLSCAMPLIVRHIPSLSTPHRFLFFSRHFGTGVLMATAFVHLLPTAFGSLTDPCLPPFWTRTFPQMPGAIALVAVFVVVGIEMYFAMHGAGHTHSFPEDQAKLIDHHPPSPGPDGISLGDRDTGHERGGDLFAPGIGGSGFVSSSPPLLRENESRDRLHGQFLSSHNHQRLNSSHTGMFFARRSLDNGEDSPPLDGGFPTSDSPNSHRRNESQIPLHRDHSGAVEPLPRAPGDDQQAERDVLQVVLLEAGILFHSIFIGLSLSTARGPTFIVLLLAISMHQTFEGLALGSRIAAIRFPPPSSSASSSSRYDGLAADKTAMDRIMIFVRRWQPWLMCLAFGVTTPIGQAMGLAVHNLFDPAGQVGLILVGSTNAVSSGFLLYAGLVSLLAEDFLTDHSYEKLTGRRRTAACAAVVLGAVAMSVVGVWA